MADEIKVSIKQIDDMKHSIGLNVDSKFKKKKGQRVYEAYRNYYYTGDKSSPSLDELVKLGLMEKWTREMGKTMFYYGVTEAGFKYLEKLMNIQIVERD